MKTPWKQEDNELRISPGLSQRQVQRHSPIFSKAQIPMACLRNCESGELVKGTAVFTFSASDISVSAGQVLKGRNRDKIEEGCFNMHSFP